MRWGSDRIDTPQNRELAQREMSGFDAVEKIKGFAHAGHPNSITGLSYALM
jgi:hypothetical protein